jgi:cytochrome c peroxidase
VNGRFIAFAAAALVTLTTAGLSPAAGEGTPPPWTDEQRALINSLSIARLRPLPPDPSNAWSDNPSARDLGHRLFFDKRLSANGAVACASCHQPERAFTDGRPVAVGIGKTMRNAPTLIGAAYSPWFFWDGRVDSQWAQALVPLENPLEQGATRAHIVQVVAADPEDSRDYESLFGPLPESFDDEGITRAFTNLGKAIAAYERMLIPGPSRFDRYAATLANGGTPGADARLTDREIAGLRLFIGRGQCMRCHNGPLFTNNSFHNTGVPPLPGDPAARGRYLAVETVLADPFNCEGNYSDAGADGCAVLKFMKRGSDDLIGAFRTPTLRNVTLTAPYMHAGQFADLDAVLDHYNRAPPAAIGATNLEPLGLGADDLAALKAFLGTLVSPPETSENYLTPPD